MIATEDADFGWASDNRDRLLKIKVTPLTKMMLTNRIAYYEDVYKIAAGKSTLYFDTNGSEIQTILNDLRFDIAENLKVWKAQLEKEQ